MKRFLLLLLVALMGVSCNPEKKQMKDILVSCLQSPSSYHCLSFEKVETITLSDEVNDRIELFKELKINSDIKVEHCKSEIARYEKEFFDAKKRGSYLTSYYQEQLQRNQSEKRESEKEYTKNLKIFNYLNKLKEYNCNNKDYFEYPTFYVYRLTYESQNALGVMLKDCCYGRFTKDGELVAIKLGEKASWELLGNFYSIPNYYELLNDQPTWSNVEEETTNSQSFGVLGNGTSSTNSTSSKSITPVQKTNFLDEIFHQDGVFVSPLAKMIGYLALFLLVYFFLLFSLFLITLPFRG